MTFDNLAIKLNKVIPSKCNLGEGLLVKNSKASWVDISNNQLFFFDGSIVNNFITKNKPSIVYDFQKNNLKIGTDKGLSKFNTHTMIESLLIDVSINHNINDFRSNDGGFCGNHQLLSFMHRADPVKNTGFIYRISNGSYVLLDDSIHIPNTFIEIEPLKILISDSLKRRIWLYELDECGSLLKKNLWAQFDPGISPDGGCMVDNFIFIALWDDASIAVMDKNGVLVKKLSLPIIRPTNCKFDTNSSQLYITSAYDGLNKEQLSSYPLSGNTFVYDLEFKNLC